MRRLTVAIAALAALAAMPADAKTSSPMADAAKGCHLTTKQQRGLGTTYVFSLSVGGTSCANGRKVAKGFNSCRHAGGKRSGKCGSRVFGYSCGESRYNKSVLSYDSKVSCKKGGRRVSFRYTQNT